MKVILILITLFCLFIISFRKVTVKADKIGWVFCIWNGKTMNILKPGNHLIYRFSGFTAVPARQVDRVVLGSRQFKIISEPVSLSDYDFFINFRYTHFLNSLRSGNFTNGLKANDDTLSFLKNKLTSNVDVNKHVKISVTAFPPD